MAIEDDLKWSEFLPAGWSALFERLIRDLHRLDPGVFVEQAKEKFGELRVYPNRGSEEMYELIDEASRVSSRSCQKCGADGELVKSPTGVYATLCVDHRGDSVPASDPIVLSLRYSTDGKVEEVRRR